MSANFAKRTRALPAGQRVQIYLGAVIVALVAAAFYTYWMIQERQSSMESFSRYDVAYSAGQTVIEFQRLQKALLTLERNRTGPDLDDAKLRLDILYNRANVLSHGEFAEFAAAEPQAASVVADLRAAVRRIDPNLANAAPTLDVAPLLSALAPLEPQLVGLAAEANRYRADRIAFHRRVLADLHSRFSVLVFGLILCGLCLVAALVRHNRLLARAHHELMLTTADLKNTADELAAANRAVAAANAEFRRQNARLSEKERALKSQNHLFDAALNNMSQGLCMFDDALRPIVCNRQFEVLFPAAAALARDKQEDGSPRPILLYELIPDLAAEIERNIRGDRAASFETERLDGRVIAVTQQPMAAGGWVATFADVTEQRRTQARIAHMARHDVLTNLPNRYAFRERMQEALGKAAESGEMLAVMCVDVDNFKGVNDSLGHPTGDALLCAVAERLARNVRDGDMVARFGGDEFAILMPGIAHADEAARIATRLVDELRKPFAIQGDFVYATGSIGIAVSPKHGSDPDVLQKNADLALYAAKADGKRTYRFFESAMDERLVNRQVLERDLRRAIAAGELEVHYQPVVHLRTMRMTGLEALLRWNHPVHGSVPPSKFIPVAEDAGLINEIGRWALAQACSAAASWPPHLKVAVNLSVAQFTHGDIVEDIRAALSRAGLRPERLVVEITESLLLSESAATLEALHRLKALRVDVAMDDFGTGYSSLSYLRKYSFDRIKIDRDFVVTARQGGKNAAIIQTIVQLGRSLGMTTVAEGIETEEDLEVLLACGCSEGQGFLFGRPVPRNEVTRLVAADTLKIPRVA